MRREILKSVENGHDAPSNNAHACIGIMMGCIEESGLPSESKSGVDVGAGDGVRVARNARDASHTAPFTGLPDRSFTFRSLYRYRLLTKKKPSLHKTGKRMIPLRLELRTACVLDRSDNQLHHRTN
jgi:hypothetical protein